MDEQVASTLIEASSGPESLSRWLEAREPGSSKPENEGRNIDGGISFHDLNCYGVMSSDRYQSTFGTWLLAAPLSLARLVTGRRRLGEKVGILHGFNGVVRPGEMLLVLGRPGSGCSTFLKTVTGNTYGFHVEGDGINYAGTSYREMHSDHKGKCIYVAELDVHFPELTLGQTLAFATSLRSTYSNDDNIGPTAALNGVSRDIASWFNLDQAFHTPVGNALIRGISGGEKRRTSLAEAFVSGAQIQCWDNSTRGLDSSTALGFITLLRASTNRLRSVVMMSIYQASEKQYENFDKVMLLYEGRQIYFGPTALAASYFQDLGFTKPSSSTTADFLTSLTNPAERIVRPGCESHVPMTPDDFARNWRHSQQGKEVLQEIAKFDKAHALADSQHPSSTKAGESILCAMVPVRTQILVCLHRGFWRLRNNYVPVVAGIVANSILALIVGSAFYNLSQTSDSMDKRAVLLFFSLIINACTPAFEVLTMWAQRPIVEKHDRYAYYHPIVEGVTSMICDLPNKLGTSIIFNLTLYFMTNLRRTPSSFFIYYLFNFVVLLAMSMYFRMVGSLSRRMEQTMAPSSVAVLLCSIYAGFVIPVRYMVPWLGWFRFINPLAYVYESLMINEFQDRAFPCSSLVPMGSDPAYSTTNLDGKVCAVIGAIPGQNMVEGSSYLAKKYSYDSAHLWRNLPIVFALAVAFCAIHLLATQYILAQRSKGDVLIFRSRNSRPQAESGSASDIESKPAIETKFAQEINTLQEAGKHNSSSIDTATILTRNILKQSKVFHWNDLCYDVKTKEGTKRILNNVTGWVKPGTLTALMGVSGAGKTTLLDVLANRATFGTANGQVFVGQSPRDSSFQRKVGYVQQEDIHSPTATVRETLESSALLRQSGPETDQQKLAYVDSILAILDMEPYADAIVGVPGEGLNIEQRKRLSIGVELVAKPELLIFLDEPISGLDSQTAWSICMLLRKLADNGQAVLCTVHQPSSQIFQMFDRLLLLGSGGRTLYFGDIGPQASLVVEYFEWNGAREFQATVDNPAEWMLDVTSDEFDHWALKFTNSQEHQSILHHQAELYSVIDDESTDDDNRDHGEYAASYARQLRLVTKQLFRDYWRSPSYMYSKMALCAGLALFNGLSFANTPLDTQGLTNLLFSIFLLSMLFSTVDQQVIPRLLDGRALYESREGRCKSYSWVVFVLANIIVELVWQTLAAVLVFAVWYYPTGLWRNGDANFGWAERGGLTFVLVWLFCLWISTFSQAIGIAFEHADTAVQLATLCFWLSLVFCGVLVQPTALPGFWTFVYRASPLTYFVDGMVVAGLKGTSIHCSSLQLLQMDLPSNGSSYSTCGEYLGSYVQMAGGYVENPTSTSDCLYCPVFDTDAALQNLLGIETANPWRNAGYMAVYIVFDCLAAFALYWLTRVPKASRQKPA